MHFIVQVWMWCLSKARNEWFNLCDICKKNATSDEYVTEKVKWFTARLNQLAPLVGYESDEYDDLRCEECDVVFHDIKELQTHLIHFLCLSADQICRFLFQNHPT